MKKVLTVGAALLVVTATTLVANCSQQEEVVEAPVEPVVVNVETGVATVDEIKFNNPYDEMIYQVAKDTVVDPYLAMAISRLETGHYTSRAFIEDYNFGGITVSSGLKSYDSLNDGVERFIALLEWYYSEGMDTPQKMQPVYCPPYENWDEVVTEIYDGLVEGEV